LIERTYYTSNAITTRMKGINILNSVHVKRRALQIRNALKKGLI